ncbi:MAG: arginyltransferase [Tepidisphaeraceae bacterium]
MNHSCPWPALPPPREIPLTILGEHPCSYLPGRMARNRAFLCDQMPLELYHQLMDAGFRRSGTFIYQPICSHCRECQPIRVLVDRFTPSKSQRRVWRRNEDLVVSVAPPEATEEKFDLYRRYVHGRHRPKEAERFESFVEFLYTSPVMSLEMVYRDGAGRMVGVGIVDLCAGKSLSSVYFYFDPVESKRGLGTFSSLWEIAFAREQRIGHYYLGYYVAGCDAMRYKATYRPCELLGPDGAWREKSADFAG